MPSPDEPTRRTFGRDAYNVWMATKHTITSPLRWNTLDLRTFGIWSAVAFGAVFVDEDVREIFQKNQNETGCLIADIGNVYGGKEFTVAFSLLTYGAGAVFGAEKVRDTGMMLTDLLLTVLLVQQPLRIVVGRARPFAKEGNLSFNPLTVDDKYVSFVSGHV